VHIDGDEQATATRSRPGRERADFLPPRPVRPLR
jgi:hypothetical protein